MRTLDDSVAHQIHSPNASDSAMDYQQQSSANGYDAVPVHDGGDAQMQREVFRAQSSGQLFSSSRSGNNGDVNGANGAVDNQYGYSTEYSNYAYLSAGSNGDANHSPRSSTYSAGRGSGSGGMGGTVAAVGSGSVFTRGSLLDRDIEAVPVEAIMPEGKAHRYKGRYRMWPGILLLVVIIGGAAFGITIAALNKHSSVKTADEEYAQRVADSQSITGGASGSGSDLVSDDGAVGNPKSYPDMGCELPDYQSKDGKIYAVSANGTEVAVDIKGINWFGMETGNEIPFGMWDNAENGTTAYQIAKFLSDNKFNAVRLPLMIEAILTNPVPNTELINEAENRAISVSNYISLLKSIIKVLAYRKIGVLLSMHTLTGSESGGLWYDTSLGISEDDFLDAVDVLTSNLCSETYWNIMGIDVKNEPSKATWGDDSDTDFRLGAQKIGNRMLGGCPNWMGFVEGINADHSVTIDGTEYDYYDWYGGGLQKANDYPVEFNVSNKVVYAPHYYTPAVYPQSYFYDGGTQDSNGAIADYVEIDNDTLLKRVEGTTDDMFGFIIDNASAALVLGEFGGLYATDLHPEYTTRRCTDKTIEVMIEKGWSGGFVWSLNPESAYQYNPADTYGTFTEGILEDDWLTANAEFLVGMAAMNELANLKSWPCFEVEESSSGSSTSASS